MNVENTPIYLSCADIYLRFPEIMEEELDDLIEFLDDNHIMYRGATKKFKDLQKRNKELKQEVKEWSQIMDTFSQREYAHRYLEERKKEIPNLLCLDSDEIYREYYKLRDKIEKATEYIKENTELVPFNEDGEGGGLALTDYGVQGLLEILQGDDNE